MTFKKSVQCVVLFFLFLQGGKNICAQESLSKQAQICVSLDSTGLKTDSRDSFGGRERENQEEKDTSVMEKNIFVDFPIHGNFQGVGHKIFVRSMIEGDANLFGSKVVFDKSSIVRGETEIKAQKVSLEGSFEKSVFVKAYKVYVDGTIQGNLSIDAERIIIGDHAILKKRFSCPRESNVSISPQAQMKVPFTYLPKEPEDKVWIEFGEGLADSLLSMTFTLSKFFKLGLGQYVYFSPGFWSFFVLFFVWFVAIGCAILFYSATPQILQNLTNIALENPGRSLGIGVFGLIFLPVFGVLMFLTIIGIPLAFLLFLVYFSLLFLGKIVGIWIFGQWLLRFTSFERKASFGRDILVFVIALPLVSFISFVPLLGWLFITFIFLMGIGSILALLFFGNRMRVLQVPQNPS